MPNQIRISLTAARPEQPEQLQQPERPEQLQQPERPERLQQPEQPERPERRLPGSCKRSAKALRQQRQEQA
jgi:hypothetical protein